MRVCGVHGCQAPVPFEHSHRCAYHEAEYVGSLTAEELEDYFSGGWTSPAPIWRGDPIKFDPTIMKEPNVEIDMVDHPPHYNDHPSGVECIHITRWFSNNRGNAIKYIWRAGNKDPDKEIEDLKKAIYYLKDEVKRMEEIRAKKEA